MPCHAMPCRAVPCRVMLCYVMLCYVMLCYVMLCYAMLCYAMLCYVMLCYVMLCYVMLCYVMLCYVMLCYAMLCYVMLCYAMLCYVMLCMRKRVSHGNSSPPPPKKLPPPTGNYTIWQTFPRKKSHGRTSTGEKQYHNYGRASPSMVDLSPPPTHTHLLIREQIPWQIVPSEIIPYGKRSPWRNTLWQTFPRKKSHSRTSPGGNNTMWQTSPPPPRKKSDGRTSPGGNNTIWQTFPLYGKSPPTQTPYVILGQHVRFLLGGGGGKKSHRWELLP